MEKEQSQDANVQQIHPEALDVELSEAKGDDIRVLVQDSDQNQNLKTTKDGKIVLIPQPSGQLQ
jgi:hypothetical protein